MNENRLIKLKKFYRRHKRFPSYAEMLEIFDISSKNSVYKIMQKFIEEGFVKKTNNILAPTPKFFALPFLGTVKAGYPIIADEDKKYLTLDDYLIGDPTSSFLFNVRGDSMVEIGIFDGDIVIVQRQREATPGDVVLAEIDREYTLKILRRNQEKRTLYLEAANPNYPPLYPSEELKIFGIVKGVVRKLHN